MRVADPPRGFVFEYRLCHQAFGINFVCAGWGGGTLTIEGCDWWSYGEGNCGVAFTLWVAPMIVFR